MTFSTARLLRETMKLEYDDTVAVLTLSRPEAMNAMNSQFFDDFQSLLSELSNQENHVRALLIKAEGKGFCAGADLKEQTDDVPPNLGERLRQNYNPLIQRLKELPIPTIAAVNGAVAGAGMSLICACDIVIAEKQAYFTQAFINIALVPDAGSTYFLPRLIGRARATRLMMLGDSISAEIAHDYGLISKVVDKEVLPIEAMLLAKKMASMPTRSLIEIRKLLDSSEQNTLTEQLEAEAIAQQKAAHSDDFMEGITAFRQKRPPKFTGK